MANWKELTSLTGQRVIVNLDAIAEIKRFPERNVTELWVGAGYKIEVREATDEIFGGHNVK